MLRFFIALFTCIVFTHSHAQEKDSIFNNYASTFRQLISEEKYNEAKLIGFEILKYQKEKNLSDPKIGVNYERIGVGYESIGFAYNKLKQYDSAHYYYQLSLKSFLDHSGKEDYNTATVRCLNCEVYYNQNQLNEAKKECIKASSTFQDLPRKDYFIIDNYFLLYKIFRKLNEPTIAFNFIAKAINTARMEYKEPYQDLPLYFKELGTCHLEINNFEKAEEYFNTSITYANQLNDQNKIITDYYFIAEVYRRVGEPNTSTNFVLKAINKNQTASISEYAKGINKMNLFSCLGMLCSMENKIDSAIYYFDAIQDVVSPLYSTNEFPGIKEYFFEYGKNLSKKEKWDKAKASFNSSLKLIGNSSTYSDINLKAATFLELANIYNKQEQIDSSIFYVEKYKTTLSLSNIDGYLKFIQKERKCDSLIFRKNYNEAINLYKNILEVDSKIFNKNDPRVGDIYFKIGEVYAKLKKYNKAIESTWKAYNIYATENNNKNANCTKALDKTLEYYFQISDLKEYLKVKELLKSFEYYE
ncbi:MAG: tetratricopeptide repeat protein [Sporocytophaga sp.]|uniref:tetratricopeptide repeat protein n=1 Tax=Sporocytophaga sp. TaxID=2231183 RepID=UPI001AFE2752|nr:tetratricopeptide repeat protein [Sporocytophaga sp.]MBO9701894.1 tetratricopeptide repeat protein [Sporocytophaga sp.]